MHVKKGLGALSTLAVLCLALSSNAGYFGDGSARRGDSIRDDLSGRGQSSRTEVSVESERSSGYRRTEVSVSVSNSSRSGWERDRCEERPVCRPVYDPCEERRRIEREMECARLERERRYYEERRRLEWERECARREREALYYESCHRHYHYCEPAPRCCEPAPRCGGTRIAIGGVIVIR